MVTRILITTFFFLLLPFTNLPAQGHRPPPGARPSRIEMAPLRPMHPRVRQMRMRWDSLTPRQQEQLRALRSEYRTKMQAILRNPTR